MNRRFVHLVMKNVVDHPEIWGRGMVGPEGQSSGFKLHSIAASTLFHPANTSAAAAWATTTMEDAEVPSPGMSFYRPWLGSQPGWMEFMPLGCGGGTSQMNDHIVGADRLGRTILYDAATRAVRTMADMEAPKAFPISLAVGDRLYVMSRRPRDPECFEVLVHGFSPGSIGGKDWHWYSLPPPPFARGQGGPPAIVDDEDDDDEDPCGVGAFTVFDDSHLWYSTRGHGTHCFDTARDMWSVVGEWALPFRGRAVRVADHGLWFGFSAEHGDRLCACDLRAVATGRKARPELREVWEEDVAAPEEWTLTQSYLVPLGAGKLCVARIFHGVLEQGRRRTAKSFGVLTGVQVVGTAAGLDMIKHRSVRYDLTDRTVGKVL
ncbi:hypothetical protein ACP70R_042012 [Stipagrostis hirtigluma subsp. patula]